MLVRPSTVNLPSPSPARTNTVEGRLHFRGRRGYTKANSQLCNCGDVMGKPCVEPRRLGRTLVPATICSIWQDYRSTGEDRLGGGTGAERDQYRLRAAHRTSSSTPLLFRDILSSIRCLHGNSLGSVSSVLGSL